MSADNSIRSNFSYSDSDIDLPSTVLKGGKGFNGRNVIERTRSKSDPTPRGSHEAHQEHKSSNFFHSIKQLFSHKKAATRPEKGYKFNLTLRQNHKKYHTSIPPAVTEIIYKLNTMGAEKVKGIFRVPGKKENTENILLGLSRGTYDNLDNSKSAMDVANALGTLIREKIKDRVIPAANKQLFKDAVEKKDKKESIEGLKEAIANLPEENRNTLMAVVNFLYKVAQHSEENNMTPYNLAVCMAPNLIEDSDDVKEMFEEAKQLPLVISAIIENYAELL